MLNQRLAQQQHCVARLPLGCPLVMHQDVLPWNRLHAQHQNHHWHSLPRQLQLVVCSAPVALLLLL
jgi:hypothetical protein